MLLAHRPRLRLGVPHALDKTLEVVMKNDPTSYRVFKSAIGCTLLEILEEGIVIGLIRLRIGFWLVRLSSCKKKKFPF